MPLQAQSIMLGACSAGFVLLVLRMLLLLSSSKSPHHAAVETECPVAVTMDPFGESANSLQQVAAASSTRTLKKGHIFQFQGHNMSDEDDVPLRQANMEELQNPKVMKKRQFFEHVKSFRSNPLFQDKTYGDPDHPEDWKIQTYSRPYKNKEREVPCPDEESTKFNLKGVQATRTAYDDLDMFPANLTRAKKYFRKAIKTNANCLTAKLNLFILQVSESIGDIATYHNDAQQDTWRTLLDRLEGEEEDFKNSQLILKSVHNAKLIGAKYYWVRGILQELTTNQTADPLVTEAFRLDAGLLKEHIHPTLRWLRTALGGVQENSDYFLRRGLAMLMMNYEFAPMMGGHPPIGYADSQRFLREWRYQTLYGVSRFTLLTVQRTYQSCFDRHILNTESSSNYATYASQSNADIMNTWYNVRLEETASRLAGAKMVATYGFSAFYNDSRFLSPHTDRTRCEFTMSILVGAYPSEDYCTLYYLKEPRHRIDAEWEGITETQDKKKLPLYTHDKNMQNLHRKTGMLSVLRGRAMTHWAPPNQNHTRCVTFLSHFVPEDDSSIPRSDSSIGVE